MAVHIYESSTDNLSFKMPYHAKKFLNDSVTETHQGYALIRKCQILDGCSKILLARAKATAAFAHSIFTSFLLITTSFFPICFLAFAIPLNLASRVPVISSFQSVKEFTLTSSETIYRTFRIYLIAIPTVGLFGMASVISLFLPGTLKIENIFFQAIHKMVSPLGPLRTVIATVRNAHSTDTVYPWSFRLPPRDFSSQGWLNEEEGEPSPLDDLEENMCALSYKNFLQEKEFQAVHRHRIVQTSTPIILPIL